jgi:hypothetical protein
VSKKSVFNVMYQFLCNELYAAADTSFIWVPYRSYSDRPKPTAGCSANGGGGGGEEEVTVNLQETTYN